MLGKFVYSNPTKLYFGENSLENLPQELACYGKNGIGWLLLGAVER